MIRCPTCSNEDEFVVTELIRQRTLIRTDGPYDYTYLKEEAFLDVEEWEEVACASCGARFSEEEGRDTYTCAHPDVDQPIAYTLVDASVS